MKSNNSDARLLGKFAPHDLASTLASAIGFRDWSYRRKAVDALQLTKGDRVVEIGCGTGRNFALLERAVGPGGAVFAVDISEAMLARARKRAARNGWSNIEFVQSDAATYEFPAAVDGVLSSYTLVIVPEYDRVIERACEALKEGKHCAVLDQKLPSGLALRLVPLLDLLSRPLEYSRIVGERCLWESVRRHAGNVRVEELYFGFVYLAVGQRPAGAQPRPPGPGENVLRRPTMAYTRHNERSELRRVMPGVGGLQRLVQQTHAVERGE
jgi:demethylmenaquinone methyltransferase/2-methoxy-6-polyprenyl-1,4-benzoquinol methylase